MDENNKLKNENRYVKPKTKNLKKDETIELQKRKTYGALNEEAGSLSRITRSS